MKFKNKICDDFIFFFFIGYDFFLIFYLEIYIYDN